MRQQAPSLKKQAEKGKVTMALSAYFKILRPLNCIISAVAVFIGFSVANSAVQFTIPLLMAMAAAFLICGAGQAINDYYDAKIDKKIYKMYLQKFPHWVQKIKI